MIQRHVDAVKQRRAAFGLGESQAVLDFFGIGGKRMDQFRLVVELNEEKLVVGIGGFEELGGGEARLLKLGAHGAGSVENQADGERGVLAGERRDALFGLFFEEFEVLGFQAGDEAVKRVSHGDVDENEIRIDADGGIAAGGRVGIFGCGFAARRNGGIALGVRPLGGRGAFGFTRRRL